MTTHQDHRTAELAKCLDLDIALLERHVVLPLSPPLDDTALRWTPRIPDVYHRVLRVCDGVDFFGSSPWTTFRLWGTVDSCSDAFEQLLEMGLLPIHGEVPHLTSMATIDGSIVASDLEDFGGNAWRTPIASNLFEYVRTVIDIREAYGDVPDGMPSDWWRPYALSGHRYDLE